MQIFLDTANVQEIRELCALGVVDGVTTNPSIVAREGRPFREVVAEILQIVDGPISLEVVSTEASGMLDEARELAKLHKNVVVKIPLIAEGLKAVRQLSQEGIRTNVTLCFSASQALLAAKAGAGYISPFVGRLDDITHVGMDLVRQIVTIYKNYGFATKVLAASLRTPIHFLEAALAGADVCTLPPSVLRQLLKHPLTDIGLAGFLADWKKVPPAR
jgi:transaldolase